MSIQRNVVANYVATGWAAVLGLVMVPVYLRYLGIEAWGLVGFLASLQAWLFLLDLGVTPTLNREVARFTAGAHSNEAINDLLRSLETVYVAVALLLAVAVVAGGGWVATGWLKLQSLSPESATRAVMLTGVFLVAHWMGMLYRNAILGLQDQVWLSGVTAAAVTLRAAATLAALAWVAPSVTIFVLVQGSVTAAETLLLRWRVRRVVKRGTRAPRFSMEALRGVWRFAAGLALISVLATLLTQVDKLLLAKLLPLDQFGYFTLAVTVAATLSTMVTPVHNVAYPRFCELVASGTQEQLAREYHRFAQVVAVAILPPTVLLCAFSSEVVLIWTQDVQVAQQVSPLLSLWVVGTALNASMNVPYLAQLAHGWPRLTVIVNTAAVVVMIPSMLFWVPRAGAQAAGWIWIALNACYIVFSVTAMHRRILKAEKWNWYLQDLLLPALAGAAAVVPLLFVHRQLGSLSRPVEAAFLVGSGVCLMLAVAAATRFGRGMLSLRNCKTP
jgi:O-antigen/teichoic acid export membrane protein